MQKLISLMIVFLLYSSQLIAQELSAPLLKGIAIDDATGKPISTDFLLIGSKGKKIKFRSESDGTFQQILESGKKYILTAKGYRIPHDDAEVDIRNMPNNTEIEKTIRLIELKEGMGILNFSGFAPNSAVISDSGKHYLDDLKSFKENNQGAEVRILVSTADSYSSAKKDKEKKIELEKLADSRIASLQDYFEKEGFKIKKNIFDKDIMIVKMTKSKKSSKKSKKKSFDADESENSLVPNVKVIISKIMKI